MLTAQSGGERIDPYPAGRADCPACGSAVVAKCGRIVVWHWAHESREDCDPWSEPDTEWHRAWQAEVPKACREVVIGGHRADIRTDTGVVVELQHSPIGVDEIRERENFYGKHMLWIFDAIEAFRDDRLNLRRQTYGQTFRWKHPRKSLAACRRPVLLDLGDGTLLRLRKIDMSAPCGGWGTLLDRPTVVRSLAKSTIIATVPCTTPFCTELSSRADGLCPRHAPAQVATLW